MPTHLSLNNVELMKTPDSTLIERYQNSDEKALQQLIETHQRDLYSFIFYKVMDEQLANDFFQETFIKIILKLKEGKYKEEHKFILWAKRIASNLIIDHYRSLSRAPHISETTYANEDFCIFDGIPESQLNVEEQLVLTQIQEDLHRIIALLPENQQEILRLRFYDELSFKEIAERTNVSINTTLGRMRYALTNLRKIIDEKQINLTLQ